jgi:hypothetical protein
MQPHLSNNFFLYNINNFKSLLNEIAKPFIKIQLIALKGLTVVAKLDRSR